MLMKFLTFPRAMAVHYAALFAAFGVQMPFLPVWLEARGLSRAQMGLCMALPMLARLLNPVTGFLADRIANPRLTLTGLLCGAVLAGLALMMAEGFAAILALVLVFGLFWNALSPVTEAYGLRQCLVRQVDYGRVRLWGSFAFVLANMAGGVALNVFSPAAVMPIILACLTLAIATTWMLPAEAGQSAGRPPRLREAAAVFANPGIGLFLAGTALVQASHGLLYAFSSVQWQAQGYSQGLIGLLWATGVIAETLMFAFSRPLMRKWPPLAFAAAGAGAAVLRWGVMMFLPPASLLFAVQGLHAGSFALTHLGTMKFISRHVPPEISVTAQGLYSALSAGLFMGLVMFVSGPLSGALGAFAYGMMGLVAAAGLGLMLSPRVRALAAA